MVKIQSPEEKAKLEAEHQERVRKAVIHPDYMFGRKTFYGSIRIVHKDSSSPSGRKMADACSPEMFSRVMAEIGASKSVQPEVQLGE